MQALLAMGVSGLAHLTYPNTRYLGSFSQEAPSFNTISTQTTRSYGWADGTDADFAKQDDQRYFRFTLQSTTQIAISITAQNPQLLLPAFSIYAGVGHALADATNPDYDTAKVTSDYLATLGEPQLRKGAFDALHTFKIGNDPRPDAGYAGELATLVYMGHAADGTPSNYGPVPGINGDGLADGFVMGTFILPPGEYTMAVGGANYYTQADSTARGFSVTVAVVPEPCSTLLGVAGAVLLLRRRRPFMYEG